MGGDGTINNVTSYLIRIGQTSIPLGVVPSGTANVIARELNSFI